MRRPGPPATFDADPSLWHYAGPIEPDRLADQYETFAGCVTDSGAEIEWIPGADDGLADSVFVFDPSFMTPWGAILLRPGKVLRRGEVDLHDELYRRLGVPVIGTIEPPGTVEGGDLMWLDERTLGGGPHLPHEPGRDRAAAANSRPARSRFPRVSTSPRGGGVTPACTCCR